jgi:hypothetical protein
VLIVGPDGCGKSALAEALTEATNGVHRYWRPGLLPMAGRLAGRPDPVGINGDPHGQRLNSRARSMARTSYYWVDFTIGDFLSLRPIRRGGTTVVMERGWLDMMVDPRRYRLRAGVLASILSPLVPRVDLLVVVVVAPELAFERKPELSIDEIGRQYREWRSLDRGFRQRIEVRGDGPLEEAVDQIRRVLAPSTAPVRFN